MEYPSRTEIVTAMSNPKICYKANELVGGNIIRNGAMIVQYAGGYTTVFPFINRSGKKVAVRCWCADIDNAKKRSFAISEYLNREQNSYFVNFQYVADAILINGKLQPVIVMEWIDGKPLKEYINHNLNPNTIRQIANKFKLMVAEFHKKNIAHGDLQHGNILVKDNGDLVLVDYDSMYIEQLNGMSDTIKGLPGYQHPARIKNQYVNSKLDYFSELIIYLSLLIFAEKPQLWQHYYGTEDLLFTKEDFANFINSDIYKNYSTSGNGMISNLIQYLRDELTKTDILQLSPLEELLIDKLEKAKDNIMKKWENQPNLPQKKVYSLPNANLIISKF